MTRTESCRICGLDVLFAIVLMMAGTLFSQFTQTAEGQGPCPPGTQCATQSVQGSVGMFGRATAWQDGSMTLRGGLGGATMRVETPSVASAASVVPVFVGDDPTPTAGVYVGVIAGHGVTLTAWHAAKHGVRSAGGAEPIDIHFDKLGHDMAAVLSRPLNVPVIVLGPSANVGQVVTIIGYPGGLPRQHSGRVTGHCQPEAGQRWGDLQIGVASSDGDSGGAVVDREGRLVGLLWGTASNGSASSVAVSVSAIADFLRRVKIMLAGGQAEPKRLPLVPVVPPVSESSPDCEELRILIQQNAAAIASMLECIAVPGPKGDTGERGLQGEKGLPGLQGESSVIDYDELAAEVVKRLPPVRLQTITAKGVLIQEASAPLGLPVRLRLVPVQSGGK